MKQCASLGGRLSREFARTAKLPLVAHVDEVAALVWAHHALLEARMRPVS